jgi:hypothetical protein
MASFIGISVGGESVAQAGMSELWSCGQAGHVTFPRHCLDEMI